MKFMCFVCGILLALFASLAVMSMLRPEKAYAQRIADLTTISVEEPSRMLEARDAVREATANAVASVARQRITEAIGESGYQGHKAAIEQKIVRESSKFIPYVNAGEPAKQRDGSWKIPVEMKISTNTLRKMLLENGFVGSAAGAASVLPLIAFTDRTKVSSLRWWSGVPATADQRVLQILQAILHAKLADELQKQNLQFTKPPEKTAELPESLKAERPDPTELAAIGAHFKSAMIAKGDVRLMSANAGSGTIAVKIQVVQVNAPDRILAEVVREFSTDPHAATLEAGVRAKANTEFAALSKDLSAQVQVAWQRGTVGTHFITLSVRGVLNPTQQVAFKTEFLRNVREAHDAKERLFERDQVTYEVDYSGTAEQLATRLKGLRMAGFGLRVPAASAGAREITIDVTPVTQ